MADEELRELAEINLSHQYGGGRWVSGGYGRSPGGGGAVVAGPGGGSLSHHRAPPPQQHSTRAAEAEDIMGRGGSGPRGRSGLYYSPPGTSYTIVERPAPQHPRGTYLGSSTTFNNSRQPPSNKKRPISPEQVLKLFGHNNNLKPPELREHQPPRRPTPSPHMEQLAVRTVNMSRGPPDTPASSSHGFGICVKGGTKDSSGVGVYISRVEEGSVAEKAGLRPGDSILEVNGTPFTGISHEEALKMLKSCRQLSMTVRSPNLPVSAPPPQQSTGPWLLRQTYSWMDRQGRPVSPPPEYARASPPVLVAPPPPPPRWNYSRSNKEKTIRKVELSIEPGQSLGLMIRGGVEYNLGIFITGVDKDSVADRAGLMIGDQILEVNGQSFLEVTHDEAVNQLKFHKRMTVTVRDVGKVPHSCTAYDPDPWDSPQGRIHASRSEALQMVDEKARVVLKKSEFSTLTYYLDEYSARQMTIEAFVAVLLELLNTPDKYTLLTELREVVMPEDRSKFDELVYRRENEGQRLQHMMNSRHSTQHTRRKPAPSSCCDNNHSILMSNLHDLTGGPPEYSASARPCKFPVGGDRERETVYSESEDFRTPSEDSGLGLGPHELGNGRSGRGTRWSPSSHLHKRTSDLALSNDEDFDPGHQDYGESDGDAEMDSRIRHSSIAGSVAVLNQTPYDEANMQLAHKLGRGYDLKEEQELLETEPGSGMRRHGSNMRLSRGDLADSSADNEAQVVADHQGNLRITVKKTKPLLGIAIEGGANTKHPLPRIINIHENGAAFDAGGLEVGQLILEVDGRKVEGLQHQEVARLIAESFARRERNEIEFLVIEAKKSNLEPKPTALIFLEA